MAEGGQDTATSRMGRLSDWRKRDLDRKFVVAQAAVAAAPAPRRPRQREEVPPPPPVMRAAVQRSFDPSAFFSGSEEEEEEAESPGLKDAQVGLESRFSRQQAAFEAKKLRKVGNEGAWKQPTVQAEGESDGHGAATWAATNTVNTVAAGAASAKRAAALKAKLTGPAAAVFVQLFEAIDADGSGQFEEDEGKVGVRRVA
jgi:hypothetical protein